MHDKKNLTENKRLSDIQCMIMNYFLYFFFHLKLSFGR